MQITWVGHATVLIDLDGTRLLTDPVLRNRVVHLRAQRDEPQAVDLGRIDAILLSHAHRDHLDVRSLKRIDGNVPVISARGAVGALRRRGYRGEVDAVDEGDVRHVGPLLVRATQARHGHPSAAVGFIVQGSQTVYFAGDTDLFPELDRLADPLDVALLPIWGWGPSLGEGHLDPKGAAEATRLLQPRIVIPIHWGTFAPIGWSRAAFLREPPQAFERLVREQAPGVEVRLLEPGASTSVEA